MTLAMQTPRSKRCRSWMLVAVGSAVFSLAGACASENGGDDQVETPPATSPACAPTLESIQGDIFARSCAGSACHGGPAPAASLDLSSLDGANALIGVASGTCEGWLRVAPSAPENSLLWHKVYTEIPACGEHMPIGGQLSAVELDCIREWIRGLDPNTPPVVLGCETCGTDSCIDLSTDSRHCGDCATACPSGGACADGACQCAENLTFCNGECVDTQSNLSHCGGCDMACPPGALCNVGQCLCPGNLAECTSGCSDTQSDPTNCGSCENSCGSGRVCLTGGCADNCGTLTECNGACVDTTSSALYCGGCGNACPIGASCIGGQCQCPDGTTACGGVCINTTSDPSNCGGCGVLCQGGLACESGACRCPGGGTSCSGRCVDTTNDPNNCGNCGTVCGAGQNCVDGACACIGGETATLSTDVQPIFTANCTLRGCHSGLRPQEGLDLTPGRTYAETVNVAANQCRGGQMRIVPGDPSRSYLVQKLMGVNLCFGTQMPKAGVSLPRSELDLIGGWICAGAPNN